MSLSEAQKNQQLKSAKRQYFMFKRSPARLIGHIQRHPQVFQRFASVPRPVQWTYSRLYGAEFSHNYRHRLRLEQDYVLSKFWVVVVVVVSMAIVIRISTCQYNAEYVSIVMHEMYV